jgi:hypothetical protein
MSLRGAGRFIAKGGDSGSGTHSSRELTMPTQYPKVEQTTKRITITLINSNLSNEMDQLWQCS